MNKPLHLPVMKDDVLELFKDDHLHMFFEGTLGLGGHAEAILQSHSELDYYLASDQDESALELASARLKSFEKKTDLVHKNFFHALDDSDKTFDGFLFDLGVSSMQLDQPERGFSFQKDGPLDMRMDQSQKQSAYEIVNFATVSELKFIFDTLGEEPKAAIAAKLIVEARKKKKIKTTLELVEVLKPMRAGKIRGKIHPATLVFQGLRLAVNQELSVLEKTLRLCFEKCKVGGKICVITFHSLEDRIVKNMFRDEEKKGCFKNVFKKPKLPSAQEMKFNPRSTCAKMRALVRIKDDEE
jgi:16S rRNA (cytosine1402-N4)-methyltransferase